MKSSSAVPRSATHPIGGRGVMKAPMASEMAAMAKARTSRFLENLRVFENGVPALIGCLLGSVGGGVIVAGLQGGMIVETTSLASTQSACRLRRQRGRAIAYRPARYNTKTSTMTASPT